MKLRKLIVHGFKSFADKLEFEFVDGVSCVVGPNGCGKSNVVDAVKWVLGEQSAKSLRGSDMLDVIFNGSSARKPSGSALVTLEFDNADGTLPSVAELEIGETVSVSRRLYRSGQSEYLINMQPARLKDIKELFLDTGIGGNSYSIIEQGRVTQFLQASQDERRHFFDEAAGISRYKQRRKEALRKLDRVEQNLLRLADILAEVQKRLRSVKLQAGKARNYQTYSVRLNELRSLHFLSRYHLMSLDRVARQDDLDAATEKQAAIQSMIHQLESAQQAAEIEATQHEESVLDIQSRLATLSSQLATLQERTEHQQRRVEELTGRLESNFTRIGDLEERIELCESELAQRRKELEDVVGSFDAIHASNEELRERFAAAEMEIAKKRNSLDDARSGISELHRQSQQATAEAGQYSIRREKLSTEAEHCKTLATELDEQLATMAEQALAATTQIDEITAAAATDQTELDAETAKLESAISSEKERNTQLSDTRQARSALAGKLHMLEEMQEKMEGVAEATRHVLQASRDGKLPAIQGMLSDYIETELHNARLVEAALAGADQHLLAAHYSQVQECSEQLHEFLGDGGTIDVICLDRIPDARYDDLTGHVPQVRQCVLDLVQCDDWAMPAAKFLLGHTFVVDTLEDAATAMDVAPAGSRFVTRNGELLEADGRLRLGATNRTQGVIARKSQLSQLQTDAGEFDRTIETLQAQCSETRTQREALDERIEALRKAIYEANYRKTELQRQLETLTESLDAKTASRPRLAERLANLDGELGEIDTAREVAETKAREFEQARVDQQEMIGSLEDELRGQSEQLSILAEQRSELRAKLAGGEQRKLALQDATQQLDRQKDELAVALETTKSGIELDRERKAQAAEEIETARGQTEALIEQQQGLHEEQRDVDESRQSLVQRLGEIRQQLSEQRKTGSLAVETVNNLRVQISQTEAHVGDLVTRALDEMSMNLTELYPSYEHDDERDWGAVEIEMNELRGKIKRLGNVNLDAITEQDELEARSEYLTTQLADIESARKQLEELIRKLNDESRERFAKTFAAVRENFQTIFRKLFGGGKADILLTDPDDILESPIEVVARPPGKELRSISLLSGGEKTMAALAMVFAFFQSRPSPFCVLDEVDAALDEANTERYNNLVMEFVEHTQFIMISHAKRTMAMADKLFGVTMQERGVSTRLHMDFRDVGGFLEEDSEAVQHGAN